MGRVTPQTTATVGAHAGAASRPLNPRCLNTILLNTLPELAHSYLLRRALRERSHRSETMSSLPSDARPVRSTSTPDPSATDTSYETRRHALVGHTGLAVRPGGARTRVQSHRQVLRPSSRPLAVGCLGGCARLCERSPILPAPSLMASRGKGIGMGQLDGKVTIVTGAANGIGAGIAAVMAGDGARVAITDLDKDGAQATAAAIAANGGTVIALKHDVTSSESCRGVVATVEAEFGPVDVLVNNAGISQRVSFKDMTEADWDRMVEVNLKAVYVMTKAVLDGMIERRAGTIINASSLVGKMGSHPLFSHYVATKFAVTGLTQSWARELAEYDIRVNAVRAGRGAHAALGAAAARDRRGSGDLRRRSVEGRRGSHSAGSPAGP